MQEFQNFCTDIRPNITYLAIGSAYSDHGGPQQYPPFLKKLIVKHKEFSFQIILVDPRLEDPPNIVSYISTKKIDENWYGNHNLNIHTIREYFSHDNITNNINIESISQNFLLTLIDRTIWAKQEMPQNTYLLFVLFIVASSKRYLESISFNDYS